MQNLMADNFESAEERLNDRLLKRIFPKKNATKKVYSQKEVHDILKRTIESIHTEKEMGLLSGVTRQARIELSEHDKGFNRAKKLLLKALLQAF